jgi:hypothetical protein
MRLLGHLIKIRPLTRINGGPGRRYSLIRVAQLEGENWNNFAHLISIYDLQFDQLEKRPVDLLEPDP